MNSRTYYSARDRPKALLQYNVGPALRKLGFRGSGRTFYIHDQDWHRMVGFQADKWSTIAETRVTINLSVTSKEKFRALGWAEKPSANASYSGATEMFERIGLLMPERKDRWWTITAGDDATAVGEEPVAAIREWGLPCLLQTPGVEKATRPNDCLSL